MLACPSNGSVSLLRIVCCSSGSLLWVRVVSCRSNSPELSIGQALSLRVAGRPLDRGKSERDLKCRSSYSQLLWQKSWQGLRMSVFDSIARSSNQFSHSLQPEKVVVRGGVANVGADVPGHCEYWRRKIVKIQTQSCWMWTRTAKSGGCTSLSCHLQYTGSKFLAKWARNGKLGL